MACAQSLVSKMVKENGIRLMFDGKKTLSLVTVARSGIGWAHYNSQYPRQTERITWHCHRKNESFAIPNCS
eukprot:m.44101 g.44101  ORF g.44101 m.44101 type:complete len:71 (+) comp10048_c0_seq5:432-644(+)